MQAASGRACGSRWRMAHHAPVLPRQCETGQSAIPAIALSIAWRKSRNHPSAPNTKLSSRMVMLWTCLSKSSREPLQTPVAPCAEARLTPYWPPLLAARTSPQTANGQVPQTHLQQLQHSLLRRIVGRASFSVSSSGLYHSRLALFLAPLLVSHRCSVRRVHTVSSADP